MSRLRSARSLAAMLLVTGAVLVCTMLTTIAPTTALASSHREAPLISGQPQYDNTDLYAFVSPDRPDTTTLIANWIPFEDPAGGPNFYKFATDARYDINIDTDGQGGADLTYRWTFKDHVRNPNTFLYNTGPVSSLDDGDLNFRQTYDLSLVRRKDGVLQSSTTLLEDVPVAPSNVGRASMADYATLRDQAVRSLPGGGKVFAGQADDPFFLDLRVFDLLYGGNLSEVGNDTLRGYNVNTVAIQVPSRLLRSSDKQPDANDVAFGSSFPYVALPHSGSDVRGATGKDSTGAAVPSGTRRGGGSATATASDGTTQLNADNAASRAPADAWPAPLTAVVAAAAMATVAGVVLLARRLGRRATAPGGRRTMRRAGTHRGHRDARGRAGARRRGRPRPEAGAERGPAGDARSGRRRAIELEPAQADRPAPEPPARPASRRRRLGHAGSRLRRAGAPDRRSHLLPRRPRACSTARCAWRPPPTTTPRWPGSARWRRRGTSSPRR